MKMEMPPHLKMVAEDPDIDPAFLMAIAVERIESIRMNMATSNHPALSPMSQGLFRLVEAMHWLNYCKAIQAQSSKPQIVTAPRRARELRGYCAHRIRRLRKNA